MSVLKSILCIVVFLLTSRISLAQTDPWAEVLSRVSDSVVSLQISQLRDFSDHDQGVSGATGFIVDAENGIILTNRHVVGDGPIRATATFQNQERVEAVPLYRDPIHDFGFLQYDPKKLKYLQPHSLQLKPEKVRRGMSIRVIGSDGGEQLSILAGTIARLDRPVPNFGRYGYNDFNTFYLQAASSTSGGSSGSPVIDQDGDVVALNAAANTRTASSFFLPLYRVKHALDLLKQGKPITRGTLQTLFHHQPFRKLKGLGLSEQTELDVRKMDKQHNGLLLVTQVIPKGVADGVLEEGDILLSINQQVIAEFVQLEETLDGLTGRSISLTVIRQGQELQFDLQVADLQALMPDELLEFGDGVLQSMSLQHARGMNRPQSGVMIVKAGYLFEKVGVPEDSLIIAINGQTIEKLDDVRKMLSDSDLASEWLIRYVVPGEEYSTRIARVELDDRWFSYRNCQRRDKQRFWDCRTVDLQTLPKPVVQASGIDMPTFTDPLLNQIAPAMVKVEFNIPYSLDNVYANHFKGTGLIVDAELGLVSVDRNTVPIGLGDATVTFFGSLEVPANVVYLNPMHNLALLKYDPKLLNGLKIPALKIAKTTTPMPDELYMLGYRDDGTYRKHRIAKPNLITAGFNSPRFPRFQQTALDVYSVPNMPPSLCGPIVYKNGNIHAVWISFAYQSGKEFTESEWALPVRILAETLRSYRAGGEYFALNTQLYYRSLSVARGLGLPNSWLNRINKLPADQRRVMYIEQLVTGTDADKKLNPGDILLAIDGELVSTLLDAEIWSQKPEVVLTVLSSREVRDVAVKTSRFSALGTQRFVSWAGAVFQEQHWEVKRYQGLNVKGVYIADTFAGSPSIWHRLFRNRIVTHIDGHEVTNLDDFLALVKTKKQDEFVRISTVSMSGRRKIVSVKPEYSFWPTFEIQRQDNGWERTDYPVL